MDKIDRLLDAMEHPDRYTQGEIEKMLHDPEIKDVVDLLDKTKSSLMPIVTPDIDVEWKRFEVNHCHSKNDNRNWLARLLSRNVAASIAVGIASFTAVAAIVGVGIHHINNNQTEVSQEVKPEADRAVVVSQPDSLETFEVKEMTAPQTIVFDDETLEIILTGIATYYDYKVVFNNDASKSLRLYFRWNQAHTLEETVERLNNFEQINVAVKDKTIKVD